MQHKRKLIVSVGVAVAFGITVVAWQKKEPAYQGKWLGDWVENFSEGNSHEAWLRGSEALREMGTNALPFLVRRLDRTDSRLKLKLMSWVQNQNVMKVRFRPAHFHRACAMRALESLKSAASPAVPLLVQLAAAREKDVYVRISALTVLMRLGRDAKEAVPDLIEVLRAKGDDVGIKTHACYALSSIGPAAEPAVPALIAVLHQRGQGRMGVLTQASGQTGHEGIHVGELTLFEPAARALGRIGPGAKAAIPALLPGLEDPDRNVREAARDALQRIDPFDLRWKTDSGERLP